MTRVKICGNTRREDVEAAVEAGADAIGVIVDVDVDTEREVTVDRAARLFEAVPPFVSSVLVTMADPERAAELADSAGADAVQLHGEPHPTDVRDLSHTCLVAVDGEDRGAAARYGQAPDALLLDSTGQSGAGGSGETHDWMIAREIREHVSVPVVLAGGLTPSNVVTANDSVDPYAVDAVSGLEESEGVKNHDAIEAFLERVKYAPDADML